MFRSAAYLLSVRVEIHSKAAQNSKVCNPEAWNFLRLAAVEISGCLVLSRSFTSLIRGYLAKPATMATFFQSV